MLSSSQVRGRPKGSHKKIIPTHINGKVSVAYSKYSGMKQRCLNPNAHNWKWYGGRGVTINERWLGKGGFDNFVRDMGIPLPGMTLGRIKNNEGYGPDNCQWETMKEQTRNRRPGGVSKDPNSLRQKAIKAGLPYARVYQRIKIFGWPEHVALTTPVQPIGKPAWRPGVIYGRAKQPHIL